MKSATARGLLGVELGRQGDFHLHEFLCSDGTRAVAWVAATPRLAHEAMLRALELRELAQPRLVLPTVSDRQADGTRMRVDVPTEGNPLSSVTVLPREEAVRVVRSTLEVLRSVHAAHMVHGNVSRAGILLTPRGLRLGGTAPVLRAHHGPEKLPERVDGLVPDASADIWGLGRVLLELLGPVPRRDPLQRLATRMTEWMPEDRLTDHEAIAAALDAGAGWVDRPRGFWSFLRA